MRRLLLAPFWGLLASGLVFLLRHVAVLSRAPLMIPLCAMFAALSSVGYVGALTAFAIAGVAAFLLIPSPAGVPAMQDGVEVLRYIVSGLVAVVMGGIVTWFRVDRRRLLDREDTLLANEERYRMLLEQAADPIFVLDADSSLEIVNARFCELLGRSREELVGTPFRALISAESLERRDFRPLGAESDSGFFDDRELVRKDGARVIVEVTARRMADGRTQAIARDVTARRASEDRLREVETRLEHSQRLEAIGRLAGTVAHDFNNFLTVVIGHAQMLQPDLATPRSRELAQGIVQAGERAASLTRQLLAFSRKQEMRLEVLVLDDVIRGFVPMLQALAGPRIRLIVAPDATGITIRADRTQMEQVLLNLVVNARDAISDHGCIEVRSRFERHVEEAVGPHVVLEVADDGAGMDAATRARIFEPFFTTKPEGVGTGLGLATVFGIVRQSGGFLRVESAPGHGSRFEVFAPVVGPVPLAPATHSPALPIALLLVRRELVRESLSAMLAGAGMHVVPAASGEQAIALASTVTWTPALVLVEGVLADRDTARVVNDLKSRWPGVAVLRASSLEADARHPRVAGAGAEPFLALPCRPEELRAAIHRATSVVVP